MDFFFSHICLLIKLWFLSSVVAITLKHYKFYITCFLNFTMWGWGGSLKEKLSTAGLSQFDNLF